MSTPVATGPAPAADADQPWRRLSIRVVYLDLIRVAVSLVTGYLGVVVSDDPVWPLIGGAGAGLLGALADLIRWRTTRYRITPSRVEMHSGWLARRHRTVARDRIRTVDSSARLLPRLMGLRRVHIGSGDAESSFQLDGLDHRHAARVQQELRPGPAAHPEPAPESETPETVAAETVAPEPVTVIARLRWQWVAPNVVTVWAGLAIAGPLFGLHWFLRPFGVDLFALGRDLLNWESRGIAGNVALLLLLGYPLGVAATTATFLAEHWNFRLVRTGTAPDTALVTRRGLFATRTVQRADERIRGIALVEPLVWRWLRLADTKLLTTGRRQFGEGSADDILPRLRRTEARELAARILPDGDRPLEAALRRHPRGALTRRLGLAVAEPATLAALLGLFCLSGALPGWVWPLPMLLLLPVTIPLAVVAYRSLGHTLADAYLVLRKGVFSRCTVALQRRAVIGWTVRQSILQRFGGRMTVGVATAAGGRHYESPDMSTEQALAFIAEATPRLAVGFVEPAAD